MQGINLKTGQDFDDEMQRVEQIIGTEIEWDVDEGIPRIQYALARSDEMDDLKTAQYVEKHPPANSIPGGLAGSNGPPSSHGSSPFTIACAISLLGGQTPHRDFRGPQACPMPRHAPAVM